MVLLRAIWRSVVFLLVAGAALPGAVRAQDAPAEAPAAEAPAAEVTAPEETAPAEAAPAEGAPEEAAPPEEDLDAMLAEATARVAELEEQASNLLQGPPDPQLVDRLELWRDFVNQLRMRVSQRVEKDSAQTKLQSIEGALAGFSETGLSEEPPYTIDFIDQLRDNLDSTQRDLLTVQLADEAARATLSRAEAQFKQAEEARRKARDAVSANNDPALSARLQNDMVRAQLASRIAWQRQQVAKARGEVAEINLKVARTLVSLTQARLEAAQEQAVFPEDLLETKQADITTRREELESELAKLRKTQEANERQLAEARAALGSLTDEAERPRMIERVTARSAWVESSNAAIQYFEQRIARSGDEQTLWERRHAMMQPDADIPYTEWARETRTLLDELSRTKALLEARLNDLRTNQIELENLLAAESGGPADPEAARSRLDALRKHEAQAREYAARLIRIERLALRLNESLTAVLASGTWLERLAQWWQQADDFWERELFVVEDRGFNLAKLTQAGGAFAIVLVIAWAIRLVLRRTVLRRLVASQQQVGSDSSFAIDVVLALVRDTKSLAIVLVAAYASVQPLNLPEGLSAKLDTVLFITIVLQVASWISEIVKRFLQREQRRREVSDPSTASVYGHFAFFGRVAIWSAVLLLVLNHMEYNITGIVTGLGIGGIAIAFALQNILGDIFCSLAILMDKPFIVGDFIVVGEQSGTVERIGIKTTRLRSIGGEEIVFSNADLIGSRVHNYKRMKERRVKFHFGVTYETELAKLRKIPEMVRKIIEFQEMARFDRVHFHLYGDFSLNFECVYFVLDADYKIYMDIQQAINLELFDAFRRAGIDFAYPTTREIIDMSSNRAEEIQEGVVKPA